MEVDKKLYEDIKEYCKLNGLKPSEYVNATLKKAFMEDKYGSAPFLKKDSQEFVVYGNKAFEDAVNGTDLHAERLTELMTEYHALKDSTDAEYAAYVADAET
ncbi:MAG: hypothetical protein J6X18_17130, partial [Bacteroidales bacterium]|nr:hypothetical protein [Bacteroidales bacterium]